jgi:hypothetical protein
MAQFCQQRLGGQGTADHHLVGFEQPTALNLQSPGFPDQCRRWWSAADSRHRFADQGHIEPSQLLPQGLQER